MHRFAPDGAFRFVACLCTMELLAMVVSEALHIVHPTYRASAVLRLQDSESILMPVVHDQLARQETGHWSIEAVRMHPHLQNPTNWTDYYGFAINYAHSWFRHSPLNEGFRVTLTSSSPENLTERLDDELNELQMRGNDAATQESQRMETEVFAKLERVRRTGDLSKFKMMNDQYMREHDEGKGVSPFAILQPPTLDGPVLLFHNALTHGVAFLAAALCFVSLQAKRKRVPLLPQVIA